MEKNQEFYHLFVDSLQDLRKKSGTTVNNLCSESCVSSRTYAKVVKKIPVKAECQFRLLKGMSHMATYEEFMKEWDKWGDRFYRMMNEW